LGRNNRERIGGNRKSNSNTPATQPQQSGGFSFVVPSEFVELPSEGRYYPNGHPLHNQEVIEIKHMTAKEEDILTSKALLKKGIAIDRVIRSIIVDKSIDPDSLLVGDRNAIIITMRSVSYGNMYKTKIVCPSCETKADFAFDLNEATMYVGDDYGDLDILKNDDETFSVSLPVTGLTVAFKLLNGRDEKEYLSLATGNKNKGKDNLVSQQLMSIIVSVNGNTSLEAKKYTSENLPSLDSSNLRKAYTAVTPNIDLTQDFECNTCGFEEQMEVPLSADFFRSN
jgi:hypothetical protein